MDVTPTPPAGPPPKGGVRQHIQQNLVAGLLLLVPVYITIAVLHLVFKLLVNWLGPMLTLYGQVDRPGYIIAPISFFVLLLGAYLTGLLTRRVLGRRMFAAAENRLMRIPGVKTIYSSVKTMVGMFSKKELGNFKSLVLVEYPRKGIKCLAFVTGTIEAGDQGRLVMIFLPTTPNPTSGFFLMLPVSEVFITGLSVEEGMKLVISGGIIAPESLVIRPATDDDFLPAALSPTRDG